MKAFNAILLSSSLSLGVTNDNASELATAVDKDYEIILVNFESISTVILKYH
jgi:hypothetical protein